MYIFNILIKILINKKYVKCIFLFLSIAYILLFVHTAYIYIFLDISIINSLINKIIKYLSIMLYLLNYLFY